MIRPHLEAQTAYADPPRSIIGLARQQANLETWLVTASSSRLSFALMQLRRLLLQHIPGLARVLLNLLRRCLFGLEEALEAHLLTPQ